MIINGSYFKDDGIQSVRHLGGRLFVRTIDGNTEIFQNVEYSYAERIINHIEDRLDKSNTRPLQ